MNHDRARLAAILLALASTGGAYASDGFTPVDEVRSAVAAIMAETRVRSTGLELRPDANPSITIAGGAPDDVLRSELELGRQQSIDRLRRVMIRSTSLELRLPLNAGDGFGVHLSDDEQDAVQFASATGLGWLLPGGGARLMVYAHFARGHAGDPVAHSPAAETWGVSPATDRAQLSLTLQAQIPF